MEQEKLCKLLFRFPAISIYDKGDFSKRKLLKEKTNAFNDRELALLRKMRDKWHIVAYPKELGTDKFAVFNNEIHLFNKVDEIMGADSAYIYVPVKSKNDSLENIYFFPAEDVKTQFLNIKEIVFVESFPFGEEDFCTYVKEFVSSRNHHITCSKKVILVDDIQYGATDIKNSDTDIKRSTVDRLGMYVDKICMLSENCWTDSRTDIRKQYLGNKRALFDKRREKFKEYDEEYKWWKETYLCDEDKESLLTTSALNKITDYKNIMGADNIEQKILYNLLEHLEKQKEEICELIYGLYRIYLSKLKVITEEEINCYYENLKRNITKEYKDTFVRKERCPDSPIDYRVLRSKNRYVIQLKELLENMIEKHLKSELSAKIKKELKKCEEKYYEKD